MDSRYRVFARRLVAVMGLGAPLVGCWSASSPAGGDGASTRPSGSGGGSATSPTTSSTKPPSTIARGKFGPFPSDEHWEEHQTTCVPNPAPERACPPDAILSNSHGTRPAPFRYERDDACCYGPAAPGFHWRGRALRGPGGVALAEAITRADWTRVAACDGGLGERLSPEARAKLAEVWLRDAAFEHASIASFARLALDLIALGAPAALVADAHRAALDEIEHAELAYGIAGHLLGRAVGPAPLHTPVSPAVTLASLARESFRDGCYGESVAVMLAHAAHDVTTDTTLRAAYARIAEDEQRHAELAYRIVAWAVSSDAAARDTVAAERAALAATLAEPVAGDHDAALLDCGVLSELAERGVRDRTVRDVVLPCIDALLAA